ncbi:hypothetical protein MiSe_50400 [Microseira wollei NIES-4236]|uniref:Uncharacterized protein n=1 Tax=Microseira wollei NIES-4236 TaxID=2530354 RepID=A0AAV3XFM0_9CYAN|nr:hypothetical protein MiSe_50400 [Microseira wollei NIES-4236]
MSDTPTLFQTEITLLPTQQTASKPLEQAIAHSPLARRTIHTGVAHLVRV